MALATTAAVLQTTLSAAMPAPVVAAVRKMATAALRAGGWVERWSVTSSSAPSVVYVVARRADGTMGCSCKGWIYHASRPQCRHIRAVLDERGGA